MCVHFTCLPRYLLRIYNVKALCSLHSPGSLCSSCPFPFILPSCSYSCNTVTTTILLQSQFPGKPLTSTRKGVALLQAPSVYCTAPGEGVQEEEGMHLFSNSAYTSQYIPTITLGSLYAPREPWLCFLNPAETHSLEAISWFDEIDGLVEFVPA